MDVDLLKGRIGEALVESIFVASRYKVCRAGRESHLPQLLKKGRVDAWPDFLVWKPVGTASAGGPLYRLLSVEVKYCWSVEGFLRGYSETLPPRGQWAELYAVLVTDRPAAGRSCLQLLDLRSADAEGPLVTDDLRDVAHLQLNATAVRRYEGLAARLFCQLDAMPREDDWTRKPPAKVAPGSGRPGVPLAK